MPMLALALVPLACSSPTTAADAGSDGEVGDGPSVDHSSVDQARLDLPAPQEAGAWVAERWTIAPFSQAMGGGPESGPVAEVGSGVHAVTGDAQGNLFLVVGQRIDIVTPSGERVPLAGTGWEGLRDGEASRAEFRLGLTNYYEAHNIQVDDRGNVFVPDSGNARVRRIFKGAGGWRVETWAGGGTLTPQKGESVPAAQVKFPSAIMLATAPDGRSTVCGTYLCFSIDADGQTVRGLGGLPAAVVDPNTQKVAKMNLQMGDSDRAGQHYFVTRSPDLVVRVTPQGVIEHIAGLMFTGAKPHDVGDGAPLTAYFDTPESMAVSPHGDAVYVCGGDEYDIRRVPTDGVTTTATLMMNGHWYTMPVHPNKNRGGSPSTFDPDATGVSAPEGGKLYNLMNCHLSGRDFGGNLFGYLYGWRGPTLKVAGSGYLPTRVYRLQRSLP